MKLLITAGPTREYIDTVRFISNASTGQMGYSIAEAAVARGHKVVLISGPLDSQFLGSALDVVRVTTAAEMLQASLNAFEKCDAAIMVAAVCDYRPKEVQKKKIPKQIHLTLELEPTPDICAHLGAIKGRRVVVGFALEDQDHESNAAEKLRRKNCDAIILNDVANIGASEAEVRMLRSDGFWTDCVRGSKGEVANTIVTWMESLIHNVSHS